REGYEHFCVPGNQALSSFDMEVPADFSSAAFMVAAAALPSGDVLLEGLDMDDPQGDKAILGMVAGMGAEVREENGSIRIRGVSLEGGEFDLNSTPDLLPVMAVLGAFADGETRLVNVPQARIKETDRITAMREVIESLGGSATELPDALIVRGGGLKGGKAHGFGDHRVVMAAAVAGLAAPLGVEVDTAEAMAITFPDFCERMRRLGARMEKE
ncbi:MAG: 3-phosphoshikimate 1-carboxyvinyltransferase, partial [Nitrospinota bacterium]|nr:3-phosphoshikimate 1-carboxyvinyltransferase [Nitrospinota bacterium]